MHFFQKKQSFFCNRLVDKTYRVESSVVGSELVAVRVSLHCFALLLELMQI